ncbi:MAG: hypothetical protein AABY22_00455 [Nanoarchaeota archaeon]|mgnify:FL=1
MKTFENYLEDICFKTNPTILDDDMPDFFDNWLGELEGEDYMKWAESFGQEMYLKGKEDLLENISANEGTIINTLTDFN